MTDALRIGVVGLGRLWEVRHKPALARLAPEIEIVAVYDQVAQRALSEARQLGCQPQTSLTLLIASRDVDALYLLSPQWFGLFPVELCCRFRKHVYCALDWTQHRADLLSLAPLIQSSGIHFVPELPRRAYPATIRLKQLTHAALGAPRLVRGRTQIDQFDRYADVGPSTQLAQTDLLFDPGSNLIDWCRHLFEAEPLSVKQIAPNAQPTEHESAITLELEFPGGRKAEITIQRRSTPTTNPQDRLGFEVVTEKGNAVLEMPDRIQWSCGNQNTDERLPLDPTIGESLNRAFLDRVRGLESATPTLNDALSVCRLLEQLNPAGSASMPPAR